MLLRRRASPGRSAGFDREAAEIESGDERRLPRTPIYPVERPVPPPEGPVSSRERLLRLMRGGRYCRVGEMLEHMTAAECAAALGQICDTGYVVERIGDAFRLRVRGEGEPRRTLLEVLDGVELRTAARTTAVDRSRSGRPESSEEEVFDPRTDAGSAVVPEGHLVFADPPSALSLPLGDWATSTRAILAKRGAGKTYLGGVMLEEVAARPLDRAVVVVDPGGVWWGCLAKSDGSPAEHQILLLGGPRGHLVLRSGDGAAVADVVAAVRPMPVILDLSRLSPIEQHELVADFCERLWSLEHFPIHVIIDEADEFVPQRFGALPRGQRRSLDFVGRMFMRGRSRGMAGTLISLRPAVVSKNLLSQVDEVYLLRLLLPNDLRAASTWLENFRNHVSAELRMECLANLPMLSIGTAYFLRGGDRPMFRRFRVRKKRTYDSSRTLGPRGRGSAVLASPDRELLRRVGEILEAGRTDGQRDNVEDDGGQDE